jgi:uncharacterized membrane protein
VAFGLYSATVVIPMAVHEPLNVALRAAGDPARIDDPAAVLDAFRQVRWVAWNVVRTITTTTAAFGYLAWALVVHGRATTDTAQREVRTAPDPPMGATP